LTHFLRRTGIHFGGKCSRRAAALEIKTVNDDIPLSPPIYEGLDPVVEPKSTTAEALDALKNAIDRARAVIEAGRQPGMPLSVLSNVAREAPLGSLFLAFLVGIAVGRRSR
jgi:hypothetical protein